MNPGDESDRMVSDAHDALSRFGDVAANAAAKMHKPLSDLAGTYRSELGSRISAIAKAIVAAAEDREK